MRDLHALLWFLSFSIGVTSTILAFGSERWLLLILAIGLACISAGRLSA